MYSAGGCIGTSRIEGLGLKKREEEGQKGGVKALIFLTAVIFTAGTTPVTLLYGYPGM